MPETYVRPVTRSREPHPDWIATWRFRLAVIGLIAVMAWGAIEVFQRYVDPNRSQDPGIGDESEVVPSPAALQPGTPLLLPMG